MDKVKTKIKYTKNLGITNSNQLYVAKNKIRVQGTSAQRI